MLNIILLFIDVIQLQVVGLAPSPTNPYFSAFMVGVLIIIIIAALIAYRKERREKIKSKQNKL